MKKIILLFLLTIFTFACKNEVAPSELQGTWVESDFRKDTIIFNKFEDTDNQLLTLNRERVNGIPKAGATLYNCLFKKDSIIAISLISSCGMSCFKWSYFQKISENQFKIGNFYDKSYSKDILVFERIP